MLHPEIERARASIERESNRITRVAARAITREVAPSGAAVAFGLSVGIALLVALGAVMWFADARDDVRETRRAVEAAPCR